VTQLVEVDVVVGSLLVLVKANNSTLLVQVPVLPVLDALVLLLYPVYRTGMTLRTVLPSGKTTGSASTEVLSTGSSSTCTAIGNKTLIIVVVLDGCRLAAASPGNGTYYR
jgi:hypothetical protein